MLTELTEMLKRGCAELGLALSGDQEHIIILYVQLLDKWNKAFNLTAVRDIKTMMTRHILDSLTVLPYMQGPRIIDVGSGGGLPGIPIAIMRPDYAVTLLDANSKKTRFLKQAAFELGLKNITVVHARVEDYHPEIRFNTVVNRAFTEMGNMLHLCHHLLDSKSGQLVAQKSVNLDAELERIFHINWQYFIHDTQVPISKEPSKIAVFTRK